MTHPPVEVVLGLPYLSAGPMTAAAKRLGAPVLVSASAFSKHRDEGPVPPRWIAADAIGGRGRRMRTWVGWNVNQLVHAEGLAALDLDCAGFVAMALNNGFEWTPAQYVLGLCAAHPWRRFSSMDMCVEPEVARDRSAVRERIAKTVALNRECRIIAADIGIDDRLMPVIQGVTADDYLRCFDAMSGSIPPGTVIGVGSMCRRPTEGDDGIVSVVDRLDRELPEGIRLHLFGVKSDGAEAVAMLRSRVASIDSQAYGVQARRLANDERRRDPSFSKSNAFVAGIMEKWWLRQTMRMERGATGTMQSSFAMPTSAESSPATVWDALELRARAETNALIMSGELDASEACSDASLIAHVQMMIEELDEDVSPSDPYVGIHQLPDQARRNSPCRVDTEDLHPSIRPVAEPANDPEPDPRLGEAA